MQSGPRHTPNPSTLRTFFLQKSTDKKFFQFSEKFYEFFQSILQHLGNFSENITNRKKLPDFDLQEFENLYTLEKVQFLRISQTLECYFPFKSIGIDQVLTKIFQIDPKLTFNVFYILNHGYIPKKDLF